MNVGHYMHPDPVTVLPEASLAEARKVMEENGFGILLVATADRNLAGFITKGSLKEVTDWEKPVGEACFATNFAVSPADTLEKAALILLANRLVLLPVVDDGKLVGVITQSEVLRALAKALGIGLEGTRLTVKVRPDSADVYSVIGVLRDHGVKLVSLAQGEGRNGYQDIILRVQGITDKEGLRRDLETALKEE